MSREELLKELEALGIDPSRVGDIAVLGEEAEDVAEGGALDVATGVVLFLASLVGSGFKDVKVVQESSTVVEQLDVRAYKVKEAPAFRSFTFPPGTSPKAYVVGEAKKGAIIPDPNDPDTVHIDTLKAGQTRIEMRDGRGFNVVPVPGEPGKVVTFEFLRHVIQVPDLERIDRAPIGGWIKAVEEVDDWLAAQLQMRLASDDPWEIVVAGGMLARLVDPGYAIPFHQMGDTDHGRDIGKIGDIREAVIAVRKWAKKELREAQRRTVADLGRAEVDRLLAFLDSIAGALRRGGSNRIEDDLLALCHGRDDYEGVRVLMAESVFGHSLSDEVELLDEAALDFFRKANARELKESVLADDERLRRVGIADPTAWWAHHLS